MDFVINEQYGQPYRFGSTHELKLFGVDDDGWMLSTFLAVSFSFSIYWEIDPAQRIEQVGLLNYSDSTRDRVGMFTFHMGYAIASVFIPLKREADEQEKDEFQSLHAIA